MSTALTRPATAPMATRHLRRIPHGGIALYETLKAAWLSANPDASPAEYEAAMVRFARLAGV